VSPISPVLANVIMMSSLAEKLVAEPLTYAQTTSKYPAFSVMRLIVNSAKSAAFNRFEILKCPLMVLVLSSIVRKNVDMSVPLSSALSIYI
jgi:hypothetical protein